MSLIEILRFSLMVIIGTIGLAGFGIIFGLLFKGVDRKLSAHMQGRIGPPIRQPFRDVVKLFTKENIVPDNAIPWIFNLAPFIGLIATISILLYLPIGGFDPLVSGKGDLILLLYLLIIPSLALAIGGFASGSPYATVGAQREMATMIAYEFPLAIIIISFAWKINAQIALVTDISFEQNAFAIEKLASVPIGLGSEITTSIWGVVGPLGLIGLIILLFVLIIVTPAELSKIPFDAPEAETEIAGGLLTEYSGRNLGLFYLTDAVKTIVMASIIVALFFPFNLSPLLGLESYPAYAVDIIFYLIKVLIIVLFSVSLIRVAIARLKIDQIVYTYWVWFTLMALIGLILVLFDHAAIHQTGIYNTVYEMLGFV